MFNNGITQFYLPPMHTRTIPAFTPQPKGVTALWLVLIQGLPTKGWPGWVDMGSWSHTEINVPHRELNPDTVTHLSISTNRARRRLTSLMCPTPLPLNQAAISSITRPTYYWASSRHNDMRQGGVFFTLAPSAVPTICVDAYNDTDTVSIRLTGGIVWIEIAARLCSLRPRFVLCSFTYGVIEIIIIIIITVHPRSGVV